MKEDDITMLFEPFNRLNLIETRHILGVGLGLTLVRNIVQIMGGKIDVTSKYGEGSTFSLEIPQHLVFDDNIVGVSILFNSDIKNFFKI